MNREIGQINGRKIYIETDYPELNLIASAISKQIDSERLKVGQIIAIPIFRESDGSKTIYLKVEKIINDTIN